MLRLALVGCGRWAAAYETAAPQLRDAAFTAVADPVTARTGSMGQALGATIRAGSLAELLVRHGAAFDAVLIATPNDLHAPLVEAAALAGKHVHVEKPLALTSAAAAAAIAACRSAGVRLMVGHSLRFLPANRVVRASLDAGELGRPGLLRIHRWAPPFPGGWDTWKIDPARNGGLAVHEGVHELDLARWYFSALPTSVYALARGTSPAGPSRPDYLQMHLGFAGGGSAVIDLAFNLPPGDRYGSLALIGSLGAAYADDHHNMHLLFRGGRPSAVVSDASGSYVAVQLQEFVDAVHGDREPAVTGSDGEAAVRMAEAVQASVDEGRPLRLEGERYVRV